MKIAYVDYDEKYGAVYVAVGDKSRDERTAIVAKTVAVEPGIHIDYDKDGKVVGIEVV